MNFSWGWKCVSLYVCESVRETLLTYSSSPQTTNKTFDIPLTLSGSVVLRERLNYEEITRYLVIIQANVSLHRRRRNIVQKIEKLLVSCRSNPVWISQTEMSKSVQASFAYKKNKKQKVDGDLHGQTPKWPLKHHKSSLYRLKLKLLFTGNLLWIPQVSFAVVFNSEMVPLDT